MKPRIMHIIYSIVILMGLGIIYSQASSNAKTKGLNQRITVITNNFIVEAETAEADAMKAATLASKFAAEAIMFQSKLENLQRECPSK